MPWLMRMPSLDRIGDPSMARLTSFQVTDPSTVCETPVTITRLLGRVKPHQGTVPPSRKSLPVELPV